MSLASNNWALNCKCLIYLVHVHTSQVQIREIFKSGESSFLNAYILLKLASPSFAFAFLGPRSVLYQLVSMVQADAHPTGDKEVVVGSISAGSYNIHL